LVAKALKPLSFYLKLLAITLLVTMLGLIFTSAITMADAVTKPLKSQLCCESPARFGADFENIHIETADGLSLAGWYIPPRNGAVIILIHSYYNDRRQTLPVAEMLYKSGYGLLMVDQRASGESQGETRSLGWRDIPDVGAAASWLVARQKDLKIGAYGCSMGGALAIAGAAGVPSIRAVAADAPSPLQWYENLPHFSLRDPLSLPTMALYYAFVMLRAQSVPNTSTIEAVQAYGSRPLLFISSGQGPETARVSAYFEAASGPKAHWNIPEASHCTGPQTRPQEYQQHLLDFFNATLR
jgi:fermentation-respiration switch protein FrsA (DUF1100 family)